MKLENCIHPCIVYSTSLRLALTLSLPLSQDPLVRLKELAEDFPSHANKLSTVKVPKKLRREVERNSQSYLVRSGMMSSGSAGGAAASISVLYVNGRPIDIGLNTFNLFSLLQTIRSETAVLERLAQLDLPQRTAEAILEVGASGEGEGQQGQGGPPAGEEVRIDIVSGSKGAGELSSTIELLSTPTHSHSHRPTYSYHFRAHPPLTVSFVNNLEKDAQYKKWPKQLRQLMYPSWQLHSLSRNLYTLMMVVDPTTEAGLAALQQMEALYNHMYPVRFGVVISSRANAGVLRSEREPTALPMSAGDTESDIATATDVAVLFSAAKSKYGTGVAFSFLFGLAENQAVPLSMDALVTEFGKVTAAAKSSWTTGSYETHAKDALKAARGSVEDPGQVMARTMSRFVASKGIPVNSFLLNGLLSTDLDLQQALMQLLGERGFQPHEPLSPQTTNHESTIPPSHHHKTRLTPAYPTTAPCHLKAASSTC